MPKKRPPASANSRRPSLNENEMTHKTTKRHVSTKQTPEPSATDCPTCGSPLCTVRPAFDIMAAMRRIVDLRGISAFQKLARRTLTSQVDHGGECSPSHATIAKESGMCASTAKAGVKGLRENGHVSVTNRKDGPGGPKANSYRVTV